MAKSDLGKSVNKLVDSLEALITAGKQLKDAAKKLQVQLNKPSPK